MRSPEFPPIITNFPEMLAAGQAAWMLTNTTTLPEEQGGVRERVEEAITNAGGVAVLPFESSIEAVLA